MTTQKAEGPRGGGGGGGRELLAKRLRAHAQVHDDLRHMDDEQQQWTNDLLEAADLITTLAAREDGCPAGWKLVPIEPNWDMRNEGREFLIDGIEKEPEKLAYFLWKTMLSASPEPPKAPTAGEGDEPQA